MDPVSYEKATRALRVADEGKRFIPFYRNVLRPILEHDVIQLMGDHKLSDRELMAINEYIKAIKDVESILTRLIIQGESSAKVIEENLKKVGERK